jgi:hypothetical protein
MRAELQRESAERELKAAEAAVAAGQKGASDRLREAENALEAAIEAGLDAGLGIGNGTEDEDGSGAEQGAMQMWGADWDGEEDDDEGRRTMRRRKRATMPSRRKATPGKTRLSSQRAHRTPSLTLT